MQPSLQTVSEALAWLTHTPLEFGNTTQIAAVRFIEAVDRCEEALRACDHQALCEDCEGEGEAECKECGQDTECQACGGTGYEIACSCVDGFSERAIAEARKRLKG
jgi:DnaJ-class molecular chaperone